MAKHNICIIRCHLHKVHSQLLILGAGLKCSIVGLQHLVMLVNPTDVSVVVQNAIRLLDFSHLTMHED